MRRFRSLGLLPLCLLVLAAPAIGQTDAAATPVDRGDALDESAGFGYELKTGAPVLVQDTAYVYCPTQELLVVHPEAEAESRTDLGATVNTDGTWTIEETGQTLAPQFVNAVIADGVNTLQTNLPAVTLDQVSLVPAPWLGCWRYRWRYSCGGCYDCATGCYNGTLYSGTQNFKLCRYTGNWWDFCRLRAIYRCSATRYTCRDCTGPALSSFSAIGWSCGSC